MFDHIARTSNRFSFVGFRYLASLLNPPGILFAHPQVRPPFIMRLGTLAGGGKTTVGRKTNGGAKALHFGDAFRANFPDFPNLFGFGLIV